jgi:hypothetical protein
MHDATRVPSLASIAVWSLVAAAGRRRLRGHEACAGLQLLLLSSVPCLMPSALLVATKDAPLAGTMESRSPTSERAPAGAREQTQLVMPLHVMTDQCSSTVQSRQPQNEAGGALLGQAGAASCAALCGCTSAGKCELPRPNVMITPNKADPIDSSPDRQPKGVRARLTGT